MSTRTQQRTLGVPIGCALALFLAACGTGGSSHIAQLHVSSPAFAAGGAIPAPYTCDGADQPLPIRWSGVPAGAGELVLVMRDPDAPGGDFVHWALAGLAPATTSVPPAPSGAVAGRNGFGTTGYRGPCPPSGDHAHRYVITVYALPARTGLAAGFDATRVHLSPIAEGSFTGTYRRP